MSDLVARQQLDSLAEQALCALKIEVSQEINPYKNSLNERLLPIHLSFHKIVNCSIKTKKASTHVFDQRHLCNLAYMSSPILPLNNMFIHNIITYISLSYK